MIRKLCLALVVVSFMFMVGCDWFFPPTPTPVACVDNDFDGYGSNVSSLCEQTGIDCNDADASVNPGATEICNGVNDDCNDSTPDCSTSVDLCEKANSTDWECVDDLEAGTAVLNFNDTGAGEFQFYLEAEDLAPEESYTMAYIPDPWPQIGLICLAEGTTSADGALSLTGNPDTGDMPKYYDVNDGAKIWLVPSALIDCGDYTSDPINPGQMTGWCAPESGDSCLQIAFDADPVDPSSGVSIDWINFDDTLDDNLPPALLSTLGLCEKGTDWECLDPAGGTGTLQYNETGFGAFQFSFDAIDLVASTDYTLLYYPDPWPGNDLICLGIGTSGTDGSLHLEGSPVTGDLPKAYDENFGLGAKIWLAPSAMVQCGNDPHITTWCAPGSSCTQTIYDVNFITFDDFLDN
jgi:hypothetical protein